MSAEDYAALTSEEKRELMARQGDMATMMAVMMKQAESLQREMAGSGNLTPQQAAQMEEAMQRAQQMLGGAGAGASATPGPTANAATEAEGRTNAPRKSQGSILTVDQLDRGHVRFTHPDRKLVTLTVYDRASGEELSKREYPEGVIDEYINLGRYKTPLANIGVVIRNGSGEILADLVPKKAG